MKRGDTGNRRVLPLPSALVAVLLCLAGCDGDRHGSVSGWIEADLVRIASPIGGRLLALDVVEGDPVEPGTVVFRLEREREEAELALAEARAARARADREDLGRGARAEEIERLDARRSEADASARAAERNLRRAAELQSTRAISDRTLDDAQLAADRARAEVALATADLKVARLPARDDRLAAADAEIRAAEATVAQARWQVAQKQARSGVAGRVHELFYRVGEQVPAGRAVASLIARDSLRARFFLGARDLSRVAKGASVEVRLSGCAPLAATVTRVADKPEFTPPILFGEDTRDKLVFLIEARIADPGSCKAHPGQPIDVRLPALPERDAHG